jgi:hypothetical protein
MSQRDNFAGGFFLGALVGGLIGGVLGAVVTSRLSEEDSAPVEGETSNPRVIPSGSQRSDMELARRKLEGKIAQLNDAIDDVRQQLGGVNGIKTKNEQPATPNSEL